MHNGLTDLGECFLHELQGVFRGYVTSLDVVVFIVTIVWISLASEVVEDFFELVALLLELGLDFADEGVETSLICIQVPLELDSGQGGRGCMWWGRFNDIIILDSH